MKPEYRQVQIPDMRFTCFHCMRTFSSDAAKDHFGINSGSAPDCQLRAAQVAVLRQAATMCRDNHGTASLTAKQLDNMIDELESTASTPHNPHEDDDTARKVLQPQTPNA